MLMFLLIGSSRLLTPKNVHKGPVLKPELSIASNWIWYMNLVSKSGEWLIIILFPTIEKDWLSAPYSELETNLKVCVSEESSSTPESVAISVPALIFSSKVIAIPYKYIFDP